MLVRSGLSGKACVFFKEHSPLLDRLHFPVWRINFIPRSVLYQPFRFTSTLSLWKGRGEGWLMVSPDSSGYEVGVVHSLADLDVTSFQLPYVKEGMLSIKVDYHWHQHQPLTGEGQGKFTFTSLQIKDLPLYSDKGISLKISSASGLLMVKERDWTLNEFRMQGEGFSFSGQGRVQLESNVFESRIESEGVLYFSPEFTKMFPQVQYLNTESGQPITLRLWGTLRTPSMELNGNGIVIPLEPSLLFTAMS